MPDAAAGQVSLVAVSDIVLDALVDLAISEASPDEVTPPLTSHAVWTPERIAWLRAYHLERRAGLCGPKGEATWAIVVHSDIAGSLRLQRTDEDGVLEVGLWLSRPWRGRGVGSTVLLRAVDLARRHGATAVVADTAATNIAAIAALTSAGFAPHGAGSRVRARLTL